MGNEVKCVARIDGKRQEGTALLETMELIFRGAECRVKIAFAEMKSVAAADGELRVKTKDAEFAFAVGSAAYKWAHKILHPKTRIEKLGVKPGMRVSVLGEAEAEFAAELKKCQAEIASGNAKGGAELTFLFVENETSLHKAAQAAKQLKGAAGLWIVYPKGNKEITEVRVIDAGRKLGLKDVKVVGFSLTHTALKFVVPLEKR